MMMPLYPPFTEADLIAPELDAGDEYSDAVIAKANVAVKIATRCHDEGLHEFRRHPWCRECEFARALEESVPEDKIPYVRSSDLMVYWRNSLTTHRLAQPHIAAAVTEWIDETPKDERTAAALVAFVYERFGNKISESTANMLAGWAPSAVIWDRWEIGEYLAEVRPRARAYLLLHGRPPADTYDPETDRRDRAPKYLTRTDLEELPEPEWIIPGVLTRYAYAVLRGRDHSYKTFIALSWAASIATGRPWIGKPVKQGRVLYVAGEGANGLSTRLSAWEYAWHDRQRIDEHAFTTRDQAVNLFAAGADLDELVDKIEREGYALVVIDTLNKCSGGADVNGPQANAILHSIERIKRATADGSVLVLAHTGKSDEDVRGWSALEDDADIVWHAKADDGAITLANTKMKEAAASPTMSLATLSIPEADSLVLQHDDGFTRPSDLTDSQKQLLETFREAFSESGATKRELLDASGLPRSTFYHALNALKRSGDVIVDGKGDRAIHSLASNAVQSVDVDATLTNSNPSNAVQSSLDIPADCLSKSNNPKGLDVGQIDADEAVVA
jgi:hypothetical protein